MFFCFSDPEVEAIERKIHISKNLFLLKIRSLRNLNFRKFCLKLNLFQVRVSSFIKRHRTIKIIHILRNYSSFVVVISSSMLVATTNLATGTNPDSFLFGHFSEKKGGFMENAQKNNSSETRKENIAFIPLLKANPTVNPDYKYDEAEELAMVSEGNEAFLADTGTSMRDPEENGGVKIYEVRSGDTLSGIAVQYGITPNTILWANDIENMDEIKPGDKLFILPVAGISYLVKKGDDIESIAKKYKADKEKIIAFNELPATGELKENQEILIPGGQKEESQTTPSLETSRRQYATSSGGYPTVSGWKKLEGKAGAGHKFPYGYCTWYVSQRRFVPWGGNAGTWLYNAKVLGYKTGRAPQTGSIIVTSESWWGHVALVEKVNSDSVVVSEMNYERWGKVNRRTISLKSRVIKGFIY